MCYPILCKELKNAYIYLTFNACIYVTFNSPTGKKKMLLRGYLKERKKK